MLSEEAPLIAGNKGLSREDPHNLYPERVKAIRWFERYAPQDFDLFGVGWDKPALRQGALGRAERLAYKLLGSQFKPFPSYRGRINQKSDVLEKTRFSICYENVRDIPGYVTEKIFDCFFSGCVPVYWGASNITSHIPDNCFIDRRNFKTTHQVWSFLKAMSEVEYKGYQKNIRDFLNSHKAFPYSNQYFSNTIAETISLDF